MAPSGTSPSHAFFSAFQRMTHLRGLNGSPRRLTEARLYRIRRFIGHTHPQLGMEPDAVRRIDRIASSGQVALLGVAAAVDPVARRACCRRPAAGRSPGTCLPSRRRTSARSARARRHGDRPRDRRSPRRGAGSAPGRPRPSRTRVSTAWASPSTMSRSGRQSAMGFTARKRHCAQRPLLTMLPSFSTPDVAGSTNTSVGMRVGSTPGPLPEARRLVLEEVGDHHPFELVQPGPDQARVGAAHRGVLAEAEEPLHARRRAWRG